jgi:hypothetical protein
MSIYTNGCVTPPNPLCGKCAQLERGRVRGIAFVNQNYTFTNISNPAEWTTIINNGTAFVVPEVNGSLAISEVTSDGIGNAPTTIDAYSYALDIHDLQLGNVQFYNAFLNNPDYLIAFVTENYIWLSSVAGTVSSMVNVAADVNKHIDINVKITYYQAVPIVPSPKPVSTFLC